LKKFRKFSYKEKSCNVLFQLMFFNKVHGKKALK